MTDLLIRKDYGLTELEKQEGVEPPGYRSPIDGTFRPTRLLVEMDKRLQRFKNAAAAGCRFERQKDGSVVVYPTYPEGTDAEGRAQIDAYWKRYILGDLD